MCTHFISQIYFYKKYFPQVFSYFQNKSRDGRGTPRVSFLSLKIMGILLSVYKSV
jgi:hypothetical protein